MPRPPFCCTSFTSVLIKLEKNIKELISLLVNLIKNTDSYLDHNKFSEAEVVEVKESQPTQDLTNNIENPVNHQGQTSENNDSHIKTLKKEDKKDIIEQEKEKKKPEETLKNEKPYKISKESSENNRGDKEISQNNWRESINVNPIEGKEWLKKKKKEVF